MILTYLFIWVNIWWFRTSAKWVNIFHVVDGHCFFSFDYYGFNQIRSLSVIILIHCRVVWYFMSDIFCIGSAKPNTEQPPIVSIGEDMERELEMSCHFRGEGILWWYPISSMEQTLQHRKLSRDQYATQTILTLRCLHTPQDRTLQRCSRNHQERALLPGYNKYDPR